MQQLTIFHRENNKHSESIQRKQKERLANNCQILLDALLRGERLSGMDIILKYNMSEYRRRIKTIIDAGYPVKFEMNKSGCKTWYFEKEYLNQ